MYSDKTFFVNVHDQYDQSKETDVNEHSMRKKKCFEKWYKKPDGVPREKWVSNFLVFLGVVIIFFFRFNNYYYYFWFVIHRKGESREEHIRSFLAALDEHSLSTLRVVNFIVNNQN